MKLKRLIPLGLAVSLLAGCGNSGGGPSPEQSPPPSATGQLTVSPPPTAEPSPAAEPSASVAPSGSPSMPPIDLSAFALAQAAYPEFPAYPEEPQDDAGWDAWYAAQGDYHSAVSDLRGGCDPALVQGNQTILDFAARSTPLAIAGHEGENAIYSPLSLWSALVLAAQCANGDTQRELLAALGAEDIASLRSLMPQVWLQLYTDDGRDALLLANSVWLSDAAQGHYVQDTLDVLAKDLFSGVYSVPMGTAEADRAITEWIAGQTRGLIGGGGPVLETQPITLAVLASSLYYRAGWRNEFLAESTYEDTFTGAGGREVKADFMHRNEDGWFLKREDYQAAYLPTRLGEMVFVLPGEGVSPESLLDDPAFLSGLEFTGPDRDPTDSGAGARWGEVQWSIPKFDVDSNLDLLDTLKNLGVTALLDPEKSDLSNLTDIPAYLSEALQLARVKVDEEGVEAAAVTVLMMGAGAAMPPEDLEVCVMDLDRPFLFVARCQDLPLFVGVVNQV